LLIRADRDAHVGGNARRIAKMPHDDAAFALFRGNVRAVASRIARKNKIRRRRQYLEPQPCHVGNQFRLR